MHVVGWRDALTFEGDGTLTVDEIASDVAASGTATLSEIRFDRLDVSGDYGRVTSTGRLSLTPVAWSFDIHTEDLDPGVRFAEWPGALEVVGRLSGQTQPELTIGLADATVSGALRERSIQATGGVQYLASVHRGVVHIPGAREQSWRGLELAVGAERHPEGVQRLRGVLCEVCVSHRALLYIQRSVEHIVERKIKFTIDRKSL